MPASYTIRRSVPRNTRRSKPGSTPSTCFPSFSINLFMAFPLPLVICLPTQQTSYGNRKRHHRLVAAMPRYVARFQHQVVRELPLDIQNVIQLLRQPARLLALVVGRTLAIGDRGVDERRARPKWHAVGILEGGVEALAQVRDAPLLEEPLGVPVPGSHGAEIAREGSADHSLAVQAVRHTQARSPAAPPAWHQHSLVLPSRT